MDLSGLASVSLSPYISAPPGRLSVPEPEDVQSRKQGRLKAWVIFGILSGMWVLVRHPPEHGLK